MRICYKAKSLLSNCVAVGFMRRKCPKVDRNWYDSSVSILRAGTAKPLQRSSYGWYGRGTSAGYTLLSAASGAAARPTQPLFTSELRLGFGYSPQYSVQEKNLVVTKYTCTPPHSEFSNGTIGPTFIILFFINFWFLRTVFNPWKAVSLQSFNLINSRCIRFEVFKAVTLKNGLYWMINDA